MTTSLQEMACPKCSGPMWDETKSKFYKPGKPIAKCKNKECSGVLWAPKKVQMTGELGYGAGSIPERPAAQAHNFGAEIPDLDPPEDAAPAGVGRWFAHYDKCFLHAVGLATRVEKTGVVVTLEGVSAIAATLFIATKRAI